MTQSSGAWLNRSVRFLAVLPWSGLLAFYFFVVAWRVGVGFWPSYGVPDAGAFRGSAVIPDVFVFCVLVAGVLSILVSAPAGIASIFFPRFRSVRGTALLSMLGWVLLVFFIQLDPGRFFDWYMD
jgi:hypothetical protein